MTPETRNPDSDTRGTHRIDLGTVLQLADGQNPQVAFARERISEAFALDRAKFSGCRRCGRRHIR